MEDRKGLKYFTHSGSVMGFNSLYYGSLEGGNGVVVMVNSYETFSLMDEIINSVASVYKWEGFYEPVNKNGITVPDSLLKKYEGIYLFENSYAIILKKQDGYYYLSDGIYSKMHFATEKDFFNVEFSSEKTMLIDTSGNVTGFLRKVNGKNFPTAVKVINPDSLKGAPNRIGTIGWYLLENKKFDQAIGFFKRQQQLEPQDVMARCNLAHCYLFKSDYSAAIKLYKENIDKEIAPNVSFKSVIKDDFVFFKNNGFETSLMNKVFADLKLEIPATYKTK